MNGIPSSPTLGWAPTVFALGAVLALCACSSLVSPVGQVSEQIPDYTVTDPMTGCRYFEDGKPGPKPCLIRDFPRPAR